MMELRVPTGCRTESRLRILREGRVHGAADSCHAAEETVEAALRASSSLVGEILDNVFTYVGLLEPDGTVIQVNHAALAPSGLTADQVVGRKLWDCYWWEFSEDHQSALREVCRRAAAGETVRVDTLAQPRPEERRHLEIQVAPLRDAGGRVAHLVTSAVNVTDRVLQEEELRQRAEEVEKLMDLVPAAVYIARDVGCLEIVGNRMGTALYEAEPGENVSAAASLRRRFFRDGVELTPDQMPLQVAAATGRDVRGAEIEVELPSGRRITIWGSATPLRDSAGRVRGSIGAFVDISERKAYEQALRESEKRFRALAELSPDATFVYVEGEFVYANPAALTLLGADGEHQILGRDAFEFIDHAVHELIRNRIERVLQGHEVPVVEQQWRRMDGSTITVEVASAPTEWRGRAAAQVLVRDITERREAELALLDSDRQLREADRRKDEFLAMLAHELRNPLAPIRNAVKLLEASCSGAPESRRYIEVLERQTATLSALVNDLLDVSRITRGLVELDRTRVSLGTAVDHALESVQAAVEERKHRVAVTLPPEPVEILGDPVRLEQILVNLLSNAAKYTDPGGRIGVALRRRGDQAELRVRDSGIGMSEEELDRIFTPFEQADRTIDRSKGGLGIGLTITKRLVELHGGGIAARSEGPGKGSEFVVTLPLPPTVAQVPAATAPPAPGRPLRVLVVDDNVDAADTMVLLLKSLGHQVAVAYDGLGALEKAEELTPDVVLLDIGLPGIDGYEVARRLRQRMPGCPARIAALTGYGQPSDRRRSLAASFDVHFVKPVELTTLTTFLADAAQAG